MGGLRVAVVTFPPATRTRWHAHQGEQILYVLSGQGWCQRRGGEPQELSEGDTVHVHPGEKHWHGARAGTPLEHLAVTVGATDWAEESTAPEGADSA